MKYFALQCKRAFKLLPFVLPIAALLIASVSVLLIKWASTDQEGKEKKFKIGIVGGVDSVLYEMGFAAVQSIDVSRYSLTMETMSESEAKKELLKGNLNAYVVIPDNFVEHARQGKIETIPYYTTVGSKGLGAILKDEFTAVISDVLEESQKGAYGLYDVLDEYESQRLAESESDGLSLEYTEYILNRTDIYETEIKGVYEGLNLFEYLLSGFSVLLVCVLLVPFASLYIKRDISFYKILASGRQKPVWQILSEYGAFLCTALTVFLITVFSATMLYRVFESKISVTLDFDLSGLFFCMLPVIALLCAFAFMAFEFSGNLISGVVVYFFSFVFLSYISGCAYPVYMLPDILQKTAGFLPMGAARNFIASGMMGETSLSGFLTVLFMTALFLLIAFLVRCRKLNGKGE